MCCVGIFLILICAGIITVKTRILDEHSLTSISGLVIQISLPAYIFINAVNSATRHSLMSSLIIVPLAICLYIILVAVSAVIEKAFHLQGNRKGVYRASLVFGNIGFMGIPLVTVIYPDTALLYVSVFTIVDQIFFWTYGVLLTKPVSDIRPVLKCGELYTGIIVKMTILPVVCYMIMCIIGLRHDMAGTLAFLIALPGIEMVPMQAKVSGSDGDYAVSAIMLTTVIYLLTLPIVSLCISFGAVIK
ncbi:MAG: AEC family transporter [Lentihominibacter sp.]